MTPDPPHYLRDNVNRLPNLKGSGLKLGALFFVFFIRCFKCIKDVILLNAIPDPDDWTLVQPIVKLF